MRTAIPLLFLALSPAAHVTAQDSAANVPIVRTARLAWFHGDLQIQRADNTAPASNQDSAALNMPISEGSRLVTGDDAEAEIEFEDGSVARLTPKSALSVDSLSFDGKNATTQLSLLGGLAYFELRHAPTASYTVSAGGILATPADNTIFRVELDQPPALVSVLSGTLTVTADTDPNDAARTGFSAIVKAGESLHGDLDDPTRYFLNPRLPDDTWDSWNQSRDNAAAAEAATRTTARDEYAGTQGYGWADLDANGTWYTVTNPDGSTSELWQPYLAADAAVVDTADTSGDPDADAFDPYGDGAFVYFGGGYVWASGFSWGWLPYRCGRWNYYPQFGWAWTPNKFCRTYGYGGFGGINIGRHPRRYHAIDFPRPTPLHPIIRVHTSTPHPKQPRRDKPVAVKLADLTATPLQPLPAPALPAAGFAAGALYRDYPVEVESRQPIFGSIAAPVTEPAAISGWIAPPPALNAPRIVRPPSGASYVRPALSAKAPAPAAAAPRSAPAPAAPSKPK